VLLEPGKDVPSSTIIRVRWGLGRTCESDKCPAKEFIEPVEVWQNTQSQLRMKGTIQVQLGYWYNV
jgi:hypothetical protein